MITFRAGKHILSKLDLIQVLERADDEFIPKLSARVSLEDYAEKIYNHASIIASYDNENLAGFCAYYDNDYESRKAFLTLIYIIDVYRGDGLGSKLLLKMISRLKNDGFKEISLEVYAANSSAMSVYHKVGFTVSSYGNCSNFMTCLI